MVSVIRSSGMQTEAFSSSIMGRTSKFRLGETGTLGAIVRNRLFNGVWRKALW